MADSTPTNRANNHPLSLVALPAQERVAARHPAPLTSFVGRDAEIVAIAALLGRADTRLLTLTGPGGIGKTRLALRIGDQLREQFADGIAVVSLATIHDPDLVLPTMAHALRVPQVSGQPLSEHVTAYLSDRHLLLVIDNLEHLLDSAASLIADLLTTCPALTVLGTSRTRLGVSGERVMPVAPLDSASARTLFAQRAEAINPTFAITPARAPIIDAICDRLDRLPLAIELAAARVAILPLPALLARLDHRLDLLSGGPRDAPPRLRDMRAAIDWSHDLLPELERDLFRRLGIFIGGFTLEAAQAVSEAGEDVLVRVSALVDAGLVTSTAGDEDEPRFTMLETIREYALERLAASGEEPAIRRRHAHYTVSLGETLWERLYGHGIPAWMRRLQAEIDNIRAALGWSLAHEPEVALQLAGALCNFWVMYGPRFEGRDWVERALEASPNAPPRDRARALLAVGWLVMDEGDLVRADACLTEALALAREGTDGKLLISCLLISGGLALKAHDLARARQLFTELRTHAPTGTPMVLALAMASLGQVMMAMGDLVAAQQLFDEALALHQAGANPVGTAFGHLYVGQVTLARGDRARAAVSFREAITHFTEEGVPGSAARAVEGLAGVVVRRQPDQAARLLGGAAAMREHDDRPRDQAEVCAYKRTIATARSALGDQAFDAAWDEGRHLSKEAMRAEVDALVDAVVTPSSLPEPKTKHGLTPRELEVLVLLAEGCSDREIAAALGITYRTTTAYVRNILDAFNVTSRTAAAALAIRRGIV